MKKQLLSTLIAFNLSLTLIPGVVQAADLSLNNPFFQIQSEKEAQIETGTVTASSSANANKHNYINSSRWSSPITSYLYENPNGGLTRVEYINSKVIIEDYNNKFELQSAKELDMELPIWGGFFAGEDYNFLVFGQENPKENNNQEVIRVVKYSKDWQREGAASLYGANTTIPFDAGSLRMTQYKDMLYIRTSHQMYTSARDKSKHQANLTFSVRISDMAITDQFSKVMNISCGYVSHSFNQFITTDNNILLAVDHGDAYPRSVVLVKYKKEAGNDTFTEDYDFCNSIDVLPIKGKTGANDTGVSVGGLVVSDSSYLVAGNSVSQDNTYQASGTRNIFVTSTPKDQFHEDQTEIHWITNYGSNDKISVSNPQMVKINNQQILLLYTVNDKINYTYLDGKGNQTSDIYTMDGMLSDCLPVLYNNQIVWYYTNHSIPSFCTISLGSASQSQKTGWQFINNKWYYFDSANGTMKTGWQLIDNKWYYLDSANGTMKTGWQLIDSKWYYLDPANGAMKTGWQLIGSKWYYLDPANGAMKTDWQLIDSKWYYFDPANGAMKTGWLKWNNQWYYLDSTNGNCLVNTTTPDGYTVDENGVLIQ